MTSINYIVVKDINDFKFNFKKHLTKKDTIVWRNCDNLTIIINSKINKMIFEKCSNIILVLTSAIIGAEFNYCKNITLKVKNHINCLETFKSHVILQHNKNNITTYITEQSKLMFNSIN